MVKEKLVHSCRRCGRKFVCSAAILKDHICDSREGEKYCLQDCVCDGCGGGCGGTVYMNMEQVKRGRGVSVIKNLPQEMVVK